MTLPTPQDDDTSSKNQIKGALLVLCSLMIQNIGATCAKHLFVSVGAAGVAALRIGIAAIILMAVRRPWKREFPIKYWRPLVAYGAGLGFMNLLFYQAFARIPIGLAIAIEVAGPVLISLFGSRTFKDFLWIGLIITGLIFLLPLRSDHPLDPLGVIFAAGAGLCWVLYVLFGKSVSSHLGMDAPAWGMSVATLLVVPIGVSTAGSNIFLPTILMQGAVVAILSSALPYSIEIKALRLLPASLFSTFLSTSPAIGSLAGFFILGEHLSILQVMAILCITSAAMGSSLTVRKQNNKKV